ncbi:hypothetical protein [Nonomuraea sp. NPDC046570]|uniref:hypothetical protein n=1 Tax=Nonomuraea sp. NPDC046570 TaxID=3155255 RepID=UPI00340D1B05
MRKIDRMVSAIDPATEPVVSQGVHDLFEEIVATGPPRRRRSWLPSLRRPVVIAVAAAASVSIAIGVGLPAGGPALEYANAAVSIKMADDYFAVTITDPAADRRRFEEAFRAVGLNVTVKVIPAAPDEVGTLFGPIVPEGFKWRGSIGVQSVTPCSSAFCGKVWMPADFPGRVVLGVGRPAEPGEPYAGDHAYDPSGEESLDGYTVHGKTVAAVRAELQRRQLKVGYRLLWILPDGGFFDETVPADRIKDDWIVNGSRDHSSDTVALYVVPGPGAGPIPDPLKVATPQWYDLTD